MISQALVPELLSNKVLSVFSGSILLAVLSQIAVPLPFTPVPITGQTFGVALLALLWGRRQAGMAFALYLFEGLIGLPVFALGKSGLFLSPTTGYLFGMLVSTQIIGHFADRGIAKSFWVSFAICFMGSAAVFTFGLVGLSFFVPANNLLQVGLLPFLPGDLFKNSLAACLAISFNQLRRITK